MLHDIKPTREESTKRNYKARTNKLTKQYRKDAEIPEYELVDLREFVGWLIYNKTQWAGTTWRQYKASVIYFLETKIAENDPIAQECYEQLINVGVEGCVKKTRNTSGKKMKKFPLKDFKEIIYYLSNNTGASRWYEPLRRWLVSGILTGLRPIEWADAKIIEHEGELALLVKNAKNTNGRAHGEFRTIILSDLTKEEIETIRKHVDYCNEWNDVDQFHTLYSACGRALKKACKTLWHRRSQYPCLYSIRHQFTADAKASGLSREEIAALMGHAVDETATKHYGRKIAGSSHTRVRPIVEEVLKVRLVYDQKYLGFNEPKPEQKLQNKNKASRTPTPIKGK